MRGVSKRLPSPDWKPTATNHCIITLPLTANTIKAGISGAPRPGTTPRHRAGIGRPRSFLGISRQMLLSCVSTTDHKRSCHISAAHERPQLGPKAKYVGKLVWPQGKWPFFFSPSFSFAMEAQGVGGGGTGLNVPAGRSEKWHNWHRDFIVTCARSLWTWGDVLRAAGAAQCRATCGLPGDRPVTGHFLWFTTKQVAPHGCTILAAQCSHDELQTKHFYPSLNIPWLFLSFPAVFFQTSTLEIQFVLWPCGEEHNLYSWEKSILCSFLSYIFKGSSAQLMKGWTVEGQ